MSSPFSHSFIFPHVSQLSLSSSQCKIPISFDSYCSSHVSFLPLPPHKTPQNILLPVGSQFCGVLHHDFRDIYKMKRFEKSRNVNSGLNLTVLLLTIVEGSANWSSAWTPVNISGNKIKSITDETKRDWMDFTQKKVNIQNFCTFRAI